MFKFFILLLLILFSILSTAQVGIGTTNPQATLDVNGTLKIDNTLQETELGVIKDSILVISRSGIINTLPATEILKAALPTTVKASFSTGGSKTLAIALGGKSKLTFNSEEIDSNDEFDLTTNTFTAKQDGIYIVSAQIKIGSAISASTNFGLGIEKNGTLITEENYLSVSVLSTSVSSPYRRLSTAVELVKDDTITFIVTTGLLSVDVLGDKKDSFCSIYQIR
ncbi:hypothetical protein ACFFU1_16155 [Algibacter miyuki]|uniref:C1q domain-containing protein n=1 Tax=Algibacter miyuki TaxID=1306933 RepID=A0ABV5H3W0_9FLAO|nr:hypothetical protein [Algibacter miyuki]MDN3665510.1 hypothetical protein [Algibacter miyuki]